MLGTLTDIVEFQVVLVRTPFYRRSVRQVVKKQTLTRLQKLATGEYIECPQCDRVVSDAYFKQHKKTKLHREIFCSK